MHIMKYSLHDYAFEIYRDLVYTKSKALKRAHSRLRIRDYVKYNRAFLLNY